MEYLYRLRCGKYVKNWFNLGSNSRNKCPSICCASFTSREDLEIEISPIVVPYRSTPFFVDGNCVDGNWLPTVSWVLNRQQAIIWIDDGHLSPSVCPSVTPFSPCSCHRIITKFSGVITINKSDVHAKGQGQSSRSQRSRPHLAVSQCWLIFNWTLGNKLQWNFDQNLKPFHSRKWIWKCLQTGGHFVSALMC